VQVIVGWAAVDKGPAIQHKDLVDFLSVATEAQIMTLANNVASFFFDEHGLDIDGVMFDFELNGLGPSDKTPPDDKVVATQARNVRLLYRATANAISSRKGEAFVSYCNAPFKMDDEKVIQFMRVQTFDILENCPNLVARPMCFYVDTIPSSEIRDSVKYAIAKGYEPAQLQYALYARQLPDFDSLLVDTFRANRIGVTLYQFPGAKADNPKDPASVKKATRESRDLQVKFLQDTIAWNEKLNQGESVPEFPPVPGQPFQVPRASS
jgi:hypothetical protein